jgi:tetratricopeptide (TPR) repeat protein
MSAGKGEFGVAKQQLVNRQLKKKITFIILVVLLFAVALFGIFVLGKMFQDRMAKPSAFTNVRLWDTPALKFPEATQKFDAQKDSTLINSIRMEGRQDMAAAPYFKAIWTEAVYLFGCGEYSQAQKAFDNYVGVQQGNFPKARASTMRGLCLFKLGKFDEAYISFSNAKEQMAHAMEPFQRSDHLELQKTEASKFFLAYQAFLDDGVQPNLHEASEDYLALANLSLPKVDLAAAEERLADAYRRLGDWPNAARVYSMAKGDLGEGDATAADRWRLALGQALVLRNMEGKSQEVQNILTEALALNPQGFIKTDQDKLVRADIKHLLSKIQWEQGKTLEAVKSEFFDAAK